MRWRTTGSAQRGRRRQCGQTGPPPGCLPPPHVQASHTTDSDSGLSYSREVFCKSCTSCQSLCALQEGYSSLGASHGDTCSGVLIATRCVHCWPLVNVLKSWAQTGCMHVMHAPAAAATQQVMCADRWYIQLVMKRELTAGQLNVVSRRFTGNPYLGSYERYYLVFRLPWGTMINLCAYAGYEALVNVCELRACKALAQTSCCF